ncbi:hypothetical protein MKW94_028236 [Papaver nudicaule]|uniref:HTH TFE/IIEalpha-type domain-containing protein n=1 Tax=Papaver nudicaule TaxID=74823 RepID=A0AA41S0K4_PAPNU|nr:hypothetical protein [Papaver nudicaule]
MSVMPFNKLTRLAARAFYGDAQVVILDALTRRRWIREEDLAEELKMHPKELRRNLVFLEEEKLVTRDHRKETAQRLVAHGKEREDKKIKLHTHSYCYKVESYVCLTCNRKYDAFDALQLISPVGEGFHCERCNGELVAESDKSAADGDDNARRRRREKSRDMLQKMEGQLKPLLEQLKRVEGLPCPETGTLQAWKAQAADGDADPLKSSPEIEVELPGMAAEKQDIKVEARAMKVLPPWMILQGMNVTKDQRGEVTRLATDPFKREAVEWKDSPATGTAPEIYKLNEEDEIEWEDG